MINEKEMLIQFQGQEVDLLLSTKERELNALRDEVKSLKFQQATWQLEQDRNQKVNMYID